MEIIAVNFSTAFKHMHKLNTATVDIFRVLSKIGYFQIFNAAAIETQSKYNDRAAYSLIEITACINIVKAFFQLTKKNK